MDTSQNIQPPSGRSQVATQKMETKQITQTDAQQAQCGDHTNWKDFLCGGIRQLANLCHSQTAIPEGQIEISEKSLSHFVREHQEEMSLPFLQSRERIQKRIELGTAIADALENPQLNTLLANLKQSQGNLYPTLCLAVSQDKSDNLIAAHLELWRGDSGRTLLYFNYEASRHCLFTFHSFAAERFRHPEVYSGTSTPSTAEEVVKGIAECFKLDANGFKQLVSRRVAATLRNEVNARDPIRMEVDVTPQWWLKE